MLQDGQTHLVIFVELFEVLLAHQFMSPLQPQTNPVVEVSAPDHSFCLGICQQQFQLVAMRGAMSVP